MVRRILPFAAPSVALLLLAGSALAGGGGHGGGHGGGGGGGHGGHGGGGGYGGGHGGGYSRGGGGGFSHAPVYHGSAGPAFHTAPSISHSVPSQAFSHQVTPNHFSGNPATALNHANVRNSNANFNSQHVTNNNFAGRNNVNGFRHDGDRFNHFDRFGRFDRFDRFDRFHHRFFRDRDFAFFFFPGLFFPFFNPGFYPFFSYPYYLYPSYYSDLYYPEYYSSYIPSYAQPSYYDTTPRLPEDYAPPMPPADGGGGAAAPADASVHLSVRVPPDATIWVDGVATKQTGETRQFVSPPLNPGQQYTYEVTARWTANGREVTQTRRIPVSAGDRPSVDFTQPEAEMIAPPKK